MVDPTPRPVRRPAPTRPESAPTLVRTPGDSSLFKGWGITL
jgi:hypothetical protein